MKATIGGDFANPETGVCLARLYSIVDIGEQEAQWGIQRQIIISWELAQDMDDGRPFVISKFYKLSLHEKANLCKDLEGMLGRKLSQTEKEEMNFEKLLGFPCNVVISPKTKKDGSEGVEASSFMPCKKGQKPPMQHNDSVFFDLDNYAHEVYENLPEWQKKRVNLKNKKEGFVDDEIPGFEEESAYDPFA